MNSATSTPGLPPAATVSVPFHGLVTVLVADGEQVESGQVLAMLEAMKMEAPITAPRAGVVGQLAFPESATVPGGTPLLVIT